MHFFSSKKRTSLILIIQTPKIYYISKIIICSNTVLPAKHTDSLKSKRIQDLLKKEKQLHKEIRKDYKKISEKINRNFDQMQKSRTEK